MIVNIHKSNKILKIKYLSNGKKYKEIIDNDKIIDIDENSIFVIIEYDSNFDDKTKIFLYSIKMIFISIFLMIIDNFSDIQKNNSFYYNKYKFKCTSNCIINCEKLDEECFIEKRSTESFFNTIYLILSFMLLGLVIFGIGFAIYKN